MDEQEIIRQAMSIMGKRGGSSKSQAKRDAARKNGKLGGRPKKIAGLHKPTTQAIENKATARIKTCPDCRGRGILLTKIGTGSYIDIPCPRCSQTN